MGVICRVKMHELVTCKYKCICVISGFHCDGDENCTLLGYYAYVVVSSYQLGTRRLSQNIGKKLSLFAQWNTQKSAFLINIPMYTHVNKT
jgi:hypothetical protein